MSSATIACVDAESISTDPAFNAYFDHIIVMDFGGPGVPLWVQCHGGITNYYLGAMPAFDPSTLDPALIAGAVGAGFFCLIPLWAAIYGAKKLVEAIR